MKLTKKWLEDRNACGEGLDWFVAQDETDLVKVLHAIIKEG